MRSIEDKQISNGSITFEFHNKGNSSSNSNRSAHTRTALGKPTPSKWDDAQKWLVGFSRGNDRNNTSKTKPRNSNADDTRLIAPVPQQEIDYNDDVEVDKVEDDIPGSLQFDVQTKNVDCEEGFWRVNKGVVENPGLGGVRSVCVRDMGTEMTPIASLEPSRTATPIRATTPAARSPISSGGSTPMRCQHSGPNTEEVRSSGLELVKKCSPLETRALAWDEAERAKYMARFKREEVKIQAWENHEKRKAEMEMKKLEVKAERLKARAQEKYNNKLAATRRIAEEKRANAEAKLSEKAVKTSEKADYIRRTGHLPSSFSVKLPSICWQ
ncbi:hypothetical protein RND81_11G008000 [Saponaria officinalis]|uniref:Remorin C-terminal domain-containing protein n=1 Tax=Saponaria officinalis TaxID=3572 RepID=A0AAW1HGX0_SAPOF